MANEEKVVKPSLNDYVKAAKETQGFELFLAVLSVIFLGYGWLMASDLAISLSWCAGMFGYFSLLNKQNLVEKIKTKAVVISSRREHS